MSGPDVAVVSRRVHPAHGPGGLERHVHDQVLHLSRLGVRVTLYAETPTDPARRSAAEAALGELAAVRWIEPGSLPLGRLRGTVVLDRITNYPGWARRVARELEAEHEIVHVHGLGGLGAAEAARRGEIASPLVLTTHGMEEFVAGGLKGFAYVPFHRWLRSIATASDRVVVTDEALVDLVATSLRIDPGELVVIPNGVDVEACRNVADLAGVRTALGPLADASPLLVSVGRIAPNKGFELLAEALGRARSDLPSGWGWALVGDGPFRGVVEAAVRRAGIGDRVRLLGGVDEGVKHGALAIADWFVHPTRYEGSSIATLEAMAHGLPVLATRAGGLADKVIDGATGLLVEPEDVDALADRLGRLPGLDASVLGTAGAALVERRFSWPVLAERTRSLYRELLAS